MVLSHRQTYHLLSKG